MVINKVLRIDLGRGDGPAGGAGAARAEEVHEQLDREPGRGAAAETAGGGNLTLKWIFSSKEGVDGTAMVDKRGCSYATEVVVTDDPCFLRISCVWRREDFAR